MEFEAVGNSLKDVANRSRNTNRYTPLMPAHAAEPDNSEALFQDGMVYTTTLTMLRQQRDAQLLSSLETHLERLHGDWCEPLDSVCEDSQY